MSVNHPNGFHPDNPPPVCRATNRTGSATAQGQLVQFDMAQSDGDVTNATPGSVNSCWANFIAPQSGDLDHGIFGIVENVEAVANDAVATVRLYGHGKAKVFDSSSASGVDVAKGAPLGGHTSSVLDVNITAGNRILAIALESSDDADPAVLMNVFFDGGARGNFGTM